MAHFARQGHKLSPRVVEPSAAGLCCAFLERLTRTTTPPHNMEVERLVWWAGRVSDCVAVGGSGSTKVGTRWELENGLPHTTCGPGVKAEFKQQPMTMEGYLHEPCLNVG